MDDSIGSAIGVSGSEKKKKNAPPIYTMGGTIAAGIPDLDNLI